MKKNSLEVLLILMVLIASSVGVYYAHMISVGPSINVYGDIVDLFGRGIYAYESLFQGPIFMGTDLVILHIVLPLFILFLVFYNEALLTHKVIKLGFLTVIFYYLISLAYGTMMNRLFLVYIIGISLGFFIMIKTMLSIDYTEYDKKLDSAIIPKSLKIMMIVAGLSVGVWFFEIIEMMISGRPSEIIGMKTTEPTFIIDLAIIGPISFVSVYLMNKKRVLGLVIGAMILSLLVSIGLIVVGQTIMQSHYGVEVGLFAFIAYVGIFVLLSVIAGYYLNRIINIIRSLK